MSTDWQAIAADLAEALESFLAYDGFGQGGADDSNRGNWRGAEKAMARYSDATREPTPPVTFPEGLTWKDIDESWLNRPVCISAATRSGEPFGLVEGWVTVDDTGKHLVVQRGSMKFTPYPDALVTQVIVG